MNIWTNPYVAGSLLLIGFGLIMWAAWDTVDEILAERAEKRLRNPPRHSLENRFEETTLLARREPAPPLADDEDEDTQSLGRNDLPWRAHDDH